jgi:phage terminase small subunit
MPALENTRHEAFCQALAKGMSIDNAYAEAGYSPNRGNAARLNTNERVRVRVAELQAASAERAEVTAADLSEQLEDIRKRALEANQMGAAAQAVMGRAKLHGLIIDKAEVKDVTPIDPAARQAEIDRLLAKRGGHLRAVS